MRVLVAVFCLGLSAAALPGADPGKVTYQRLAAPDLDRYTNSPTPAQQQWIRTHFARMVVFSPYFDDKTSWYPNGLVYANLYGIPRESPILRDHPEWALHNLRGDPLYIPWGCAQGVCPQYAGDIANPEFRTWWIRQTEATLSRGYLGLWIDDVNMEFRVSDGNGNQVQPVDFTTGRLMTWPLWRNHVAGFVEQIRKAFPNVEIVHNAIWFAGPAGVRDADPAIQRQILAADNLNIERGIASDANLTGGAGMWSLSALFKFIDRVHALGRGVTLGEYALDRTAQEYALAGYFLISSGTDRFSDAATNPDHWWQGYDVELGRPLGGRTYSNGVFQRRFSSGLVLLGEPGLHRTTINLGSVFITLDGRAVRSVELSAGEGLILRGEQVSTHP
jgi:Hypothetical glycosyl hydrolase family 15